MADQDKKAEKREVQEKLNKQYIDSKINPIIEPMALKLFSDLKTKDPVSLFYLTSYLFILTD